MRHAQPVRAGVFPFFMAFPFSMGHPYGGTRGRGMAGVLGHPSFMAFPFLPTGRRGIPGAGGRRPRTKRGGRR